MFNHFVEKQINITEGVQNNKKRARKKALSKGLAEIKEIQKIDEIEDMKKSRRMMINKISAKNYRQKKKKYIDELEKRIKTLEAESLLHKQNLELDTTFSGIINSVRIYLF